MLIVQIVDIVWTKATRGAPRSNERAALPRAFPLDGTEGVFVVANHTLREPEGFVPRHESTTSSPWVPPSIHVLTLLARPDGGFVVGVLGTPHAGQPPRRPQLEAAFVVPGEFLRVVVNARHASYSGQCYSETTFNVACGPRISGDRFVAGPPDRIVDLRVDLF